MSYGAVTNLVGGGLAATTIAILTDSFFRDNSKLHESFGAVGASAGACALSADAGCDASSFPDYG